MKIKETELFSVKCRARTEIRRLVVQRGGYLRAKWRFLRYARNQREHRKFVSEREAEQGKGCRQLCILSE